MEKRSMKAEMVLLAVPAEMLREAGITAGHMTQMYVDGNRLILESLDDTGGFVCGGGCESCPCADNCGKAEAMV